MGRYSSRRSSSSLTHSHRNRYHSHANPYINRTPQSGGRRRMHLQHVFMGSSGATSRRGSIPSMTSSERSSITSSRAASILGGLAGGAVGAYVAGPAGASAGYQIGSMIVGSSKKTMGTNTVYNAQAMRASMKTRGHKNVKSIKGKRRPIHVSKSLREKVKKVVESKKYFGSYTTLKQCIIGVARNGIVAANNDYSRTLSVGQYSGQLMYVRTGTNTTKTACRWWYNGAPYVGDIVPIGYDFNYFTPQKLMDAAAVCWNSKPIAPDYTLQAGNFYNSTVTASGAASTTSSSNPNVLGLKLHIVNSFVTFLLKNCSQRVLKVTAYHCVPKVAVPTALPLSAFRSAIQNQGQNSTDSNRIFRQFGDNVATQVPDVYLNDCGVEPNMFPGFNSTYKYETKEMLISPGETCAHSVQGPKNMDVDFSKLYLSGTNEAAGLWKKTSCSVMFKVEIDLQFATTGLPGGTNGTGRFAPLLDGISDPIAVEIQETYKLTMPDIAGFIESNTAAGTEQVLNSRRNSRVFANFTSTPGIVQPGYNRYDEENAAAVIAPSVVN